MLNRQVASMPSLCLALGLVLGLFGPLQAIETPAALAATADPIASVTDTNLASIAGARQCRRFVQ
jgi:hypothetical protein